MSAFAALPFQGFRILFLLTLGTVCTSSLIPSMGYFIIEGLQQPAWKIGFYTGLVTILTLVINRRFGRLLDGSVPVRRLLGLSIAGFLAFAGLLSSSPGFEVLVLAGAPLMALANGAMATTFTFGRLYANESKLDAGRYNALLRMGVSLAWMIGPAAAFFLIAEIGFQKTYMISGAAGVLWLLAWHLIVPADFRAPLKTTTTQNAEAANWPLRFAAFACVLFALGNVLFVSAMPIYFIKEVGLPGFTPGLTLSLKCLVEVIVILSAARLAERFGSRQVLTFAALLAVGSFLLMAHASSVFQAGAFSMLEGVYYGLFAGVAISYIQSFIPDKPGQATALYMNSLFLGGMIGSVSMGFIADAFDFRTVVFAAACAGAGAFLLLTLTRNVATQPK
ncbi:MFS transporter [Roseibium sp.]|uniref:MFS transporter n=1 Tax=Roseibium sp. TaxID=1936156 RepID=UPI003A9711C5